MNPFAGFKICIAAFSLSAISVFAAPNFSMIGYATVRDDSCATTTGGAGGAARTISTLADLQTWATGREKNTTPEIVTISGQLSSGTSVVVTIKHGANITILGAQGEDMKNIGFNIVDYKNVIIQYMKIHEVDYPDDALTIASSHHIWVDQCELFSKIGAGITVDTYDGLLDIKKGSHAVTVSWCRLHDHMKCSLVGHTDNLSQQAEDSQIRVTYHHNWFYNTDGRNPSLRYGAVHMFNNIYENITDYGLAARDGGHAKVENCHYHNVRLPMSTDKFMDTSSSNGDKIGGYICQTGNTFTGTCGPDTISRTGCDFWNSTTLPYNYTLDSVSSLETMVKQNSGIPGTPVSVADGKNNPSINPVAFSTKKIMVRAGFKLSAAAGAVIGTVFDIHGRKITSSSRSNVLHSNGIYILEIK